MKKSIVNAFLEGVGEAISFVLAAPLIVLFVLWVIK